MHDATSQYSLGFLLSLLRLKIEAQYQKADAPATKREARIILYHILVCLLLNGHNQIRY